MRLDKIKYTSAVFFGILSLVWMLILAVLQWVARDAITGITGVSLEPLSLFVIQPLLGAIISFLAVVLAIFIYNIVARKFPIAWEVKK